MDAMQVQSVSKSVHVSAHLGSLELIPETKSVHSRAHLKRTVQIKKEQENMAKALHASFIAIDKKAKREEAKKKRDGMKCYKMKDMFSALEDIPSITVESLFEKMAI